MEKKTKAAYDPDAAAGIHIFPDGRASDMDSRTVMSHDGCNPVNRDRELARAHEEEDALFPGILPGIIPGSLTGSQPEDMPPLPPAFFPGSGLYNGM